MKLVTYDRGKAARAGLALGEMIVDLEAGDAALGRGKLPASVRVLLKGGEPALEAARKLAAKAARLIEKIAAGKEQRPAWILPEAKVHFCPPLPDPEKIVCVGQNYIDHIHEQERLLGRKLKIPEAPVFFAKFRTALTGPYDPIRIPPKSVTQAVDFEVELAIVIGRETKGVKQKEALDCVAGYMVLNDVSARDCQRADGQWVRGKSLDSFGPCGPWLVTRDEVENPHQLGLWSAVNGQTMQESTTANMIFKIPKVISYLSAAITLKPGDIISTGTPPGVGMFREPPVLLGPGDVVECGVAGIGVICNVCEKA